ncbi:putative LRR receptor-like serine/threonine-protein kinase [Citrus sinensis]|nr:putative LRR receptor-like serine/threonine-protein kinase [Citrus sinensis]
MIATCSPHKTAFASAISTFPEFFSVLTAAAMISPLKFLITTPSPASLFSSSIAASTLILIHPSSGGHHCWCFVVTISAQNSSSGFSEEEFFHTFFAILQSKRAWAKVSIWLLHTGHVASYITLFFHRFSAVVRRLCLEKIKNNNGSTLKRICAITQLGHMPFQPLFSKFPCPLLNLSFGLVLLTMSLDTARNSEGSCTSSFYFCCSFHIIIYVPISGILLSDCGCLLLRKLIMCTSSQLKVSNKQSTQEPNSNQQTMMRNSAINNTNQHTQINFSFTNPIKLDRSNYLLWCSQVLASIRGNRLEDFITGIKSAPEENILLTGVDGSTQQIENPEYQIWRSHDQILLGWLLSTLSEGILSLVINCESSSGVWKTLEKKFGVQSEARVLQLRYELNTLKKESLSIEDYCVKMKAIADKLASAGSSITEKDLMLTILNGLGSGYRDIATFITGSRMEFDDAYALLLTHETRLEQDQDDKSMFNANYAYTNAYTNAFHPKVYYAQPRGNFRRGGYYGGRNVFSGRGNMNLSPRMFNGGFRGGFGRGYPVGNPFNGNNPLAPRSSPSVIKNGSQGAFNNNPVDSICQIYFKSGHTADICWHRFVEDYVPMPRGFGKGKAPRAAYMSNFDGPVPNPNFEDYENFNYMSSAYNLMSGSSYYSGFDACIPGAAFMANFEGVADDGWYLDSGATHHLTNNMENLQISEEFKGTDQLIIGNGEGLSITHVGFAFLSQRASNSLSAHSRTALKDILLVPSITKSLLSISKLTSDNPITVEFCGNVCFVKDMKGQVLLQGLAEKGLYKLLLSSNPSSSFSSSHLCHTQLNKHISMLSSFQSFDSPSKACYNSVSNKCKTKSDVMTLLHRKFGHPSSMILMHLAKSYICGSFGACDSVCCCVGDNETEGTCSLLSELADGRSSQLLSVKDNVERLEKFILEFSKTFALKDLGILSYFLGIEVSYADGCMYLSQRKYINDLLSKADMLDCKGCDTPIVTGLKLQKEVKGYLGQYVEDATSYRSLVGDLQYLVLTRPEIAFAVHKLSQYVTAPTLQHIMACKRVLRYLKETMDYGLKFSAGGKMEITGFTDADWACDIDDRKSIEIAWIQSLFSELNIRCISVPIIWCDNMSATKLAKNPVYHSRTKHIELDMHFVRDKVLAEELEIHFIPSEEQIADVLTNPLTFIHFNYFRNKLNVQPCPLSLRGAVKEAHNVYKQSAQAFEEGDLAALQAFKSMISHDPQGILNSWNDSRHFCEWEGITCGRRHRRVTALDLRSKALSGLLSPRIGNLSFLKEINLMNNTIQGEIPLEFGRLHRLETLLLSYNSLVGKIPANLSYCSRLTVLFLGNNKLVGSIPFEFVSLYRLKQLALPMNNLTGGIPPFLGNLTSLEVVSLDGNPFGGNIPDSLGQLKELKTLGIGGNNLPGTIPPSIYNLSFLVIFSVSENQMHGSLPPSLGLYFPNLKLFQMNENFFSGSIPISLSNASKLEYVEIASNSFFGKLSVNFGGMKNLSDLILEHNNLGSGESDEMGFMNSLANCSKLQVLSLGGNQFRGALPHSIANLSSQLQILVLGTNQLYGSIPSGIGNLVNLYSLQIEENQFTGSIPKEMGKLLNLQGLDFGGNHFLGEIPFTLGNLSSLYEIFLSDNNLSGVIPSSLGNLERLAFLEMFANELSGTIPEDIFNISSLSVSLNLAENHFVGSIPPRIGNLKALRSFDVSNNDLSGEIPGELGLCSSLEEIYLAGNFFCGFIPSFFRASRGIRKVDLSRNNFFGQIPIFLEALSLEYLNLSFNDFEGKLPTREIFANASAISVVGCNRLCGGIHELKLPKCTEHESSSQKISQRLKIIISTASAFLGLVIVSFFIFYWHKRRRGPSRQPSRLLTRKTLLRISYKSLLKATDGFSSTQLIGVGSFGSVYKGVFDEDRTVVAIKVINLQRQGASQSFKAECKALKNIRHRNLVKVITSCSSIDFQGHDFKAIVYEYMPNGSLEKWLHPEAVAQRDEEIGIQKLTLLQRISIAIDVASALDYLHHHCQEPILHCDLKPSNILLDNDLTAQIGDFGLARIFRQAVSNPALTSSVGVRGTIGYAAPGYNLYSIS